MATLATRADLDQPEGPSYIDELLRASFQASDDQPTKDAKALARLTAALEDADAKIRSYLDAPLEWIEYLETDLKNLRPWARDWATMFLQQRTKAARNDQGIKERMKDALMVLKDMRERKTWTGTTVFHQPTASESVASASRFALRKLTGMI